MHSSASPIKKLRMLSLVSALAVVGGLFWFSPASPVRAGSTVQVTIHYYRPDGAYTSPGNCGPSVFPDSNLTTCGWNLWMWDADASGNGSGAGYSFNGTDSYGPVASFQIACTTCSRIGFLIRDSIPGNEWNSKDTSDNRYVPITNGTAEEVWVISGDPTNYYSLQAAENAAKPRIKAAFLDGAKNVVFSTSTPQVLASGGNGFGVKDTTTGKTISAIAESDAYQFPGLTPAVAGSFQHLLKGDSDWNANSTVTRMKQVSGDLYEKTINIPKAGTYLYKVAYPNWTQSFPSGNVTLQVLAPGPVTFDFTPSTGGVFDSIGSAGVALPPNGPGWKTDLISLKLKSAPNVRDSLTVAGTNMSAFPVIPRNVLNGKRYYFAGKLGALFTPKATTFRVWTPTASRVTLSLFNTETGAVTKTVAMKPYKHGTWQAKVAGNLNGRYYLYNVTIDGQTSIAVDPYARGIAVNGTRAMVVNLGATNPPGWKKDKHLGVKNPVDSTVYELDVRDYSIDANSGVKAAYRGKYLALTQHGTVGPGGVQTGIDSIKALGVKDVELMPTYAFNSVDETNPNVQNWGYDPRNYNVPEGQYATNPHGAARIREYKQMVQSIHKSGMGVLFDGVYTHVYDASVFNPLVNEYYLRTDDSGGYISGTGAGPDLAIDRPMVQKFVEDSMIYWLQQYHVDGFRLDWMSLYGRSALTKISADLHKLFPHIVIFGEPWESSGDEVQGGLAATQQVTEQDAYNGLRVPGVALLNDWFRNPVCCGAFDTNPEYGDGNPNATASAPYTIPSKQGVEQGLTGSIDYNATLHGWATNPSQTLNYATNHDGYTLWDRINDFSDKSASTADKISMDELTQAIIFTSQGIAETTEGEEMLRTKGDSNNSYNSGDATNEIDWSRKAQYPSVFAYYAGLFHLRNAHPAFRMTTGAEVRKNLTFLPSPDPTIAFQLNGSAVKDSWKSIVVIYNPTASPTSVNLPAGSWTVVGTNGTIGTSPIGGAVSTSVSVPAYTAEVLHQ